MANKSSGNGNGGPAIVRCAVCTRKSTEEGLNPDFNSLDAQRDSGEAYVLPPDRRGWTLLPDQYEDGRFTGANMDRPASRRLLADVQAKQGSGEVVADRVREWSEVSPCLPCGVRRGREAAQETRAFYERDLERRLGAAPQPRPAAEGATIRYQVMSSVPEDRIPMIPVHVRSDNRQIQLQRTAMPRIMAVDPALQPNPARPRTFLLRQGLENERAEGCLLHEEEVPRAEALVTRTFQRTRWRDGRVWLWLGLRKRTRRAEGTSSLAFDRVVGIPPSD